MILLNNELLFLNPPKESEISAYSSTFYFLKGTVGCRESHKYLYQKYNIREVDDPELADMIVMEWPTFKTKKVLQKVVNDSINLMMDETFFYIDKYKTYSTQIEDIFKKYPAKSKISINTFLSYFLSDREELNTSMFLDLYNKMQHVSTQESANVIASRVVNLDIINYKNIIGCIMNAGYSSKFEHFSYSNTFFKKSKHSTIVKISLETLLSLYYKSLLTNKETKIVEEIIDSKPEFFDFIHNMKKIWPYIDIKINKNQPVLIKETKPTVANWGEF
jgi:hypothetical protein